MNSGHWEERRSSVGTAADEDELVYLWSNLKDDVLVQVAARHGVRGAEMLSRDELISTLRRTFRGGERRVRGGEEECNSGAARARDSFKGVAVEADQYRRRELIGAERIRYTQNGQRGQTTETGKDIGAAEHTGGGEHGRGKGRGRKVEEAQSVSLPGDTVYCFECNTLNEAVLGAERAQCLGCGTELQLDTLTRLEKVWMHILLYIIS